MAKNPNVDPGDVIEFSYTDRHNNNDYKTNIFVLNPDQEDYLHGLKLEKMEEEQIEELYDQVREVNKNKIKKWINQRAHIDYWKIDDPENFYYRYVKPIFQNMKVPYRTYKISQMRNVKVVDNKLQATMEKKWESRGGA